MSLKNLVKDKIYFKHINNLGAIDFFLANNSLAFQNTKKPAFTGLPDSRKLVLTMLKTAFSSKKQIKRTGLPKLQKN